MTPAQDAEIATLQGIIHSLRLQCDAHQQDQEARLAEIAATSQSLAALEQELRERVQRDGPMPEQNDIEVWVERLTAIRAALGAPQE